MCHVSFPCRAEFGEKRLFSRIGIVFSSHLDKPVQRNRRVTVKGYLATGSQDKTPSYLAGYLAGKYLPLSPGFSGPGS